MCADAKVEPPFGGAATGAASDKPAAIGDADLLRNWPAWPPSWLWPDDAATGRRCLDTGVVVYAFADAASYCRHFGIAEEDLTRRKRDWLERAEASGVPLTMAEPCECVARRGIERRFREAVGGLPRPLASARLEGVHRHVPYKAAALARARAFVERVVAGEGGVCRYTRKRFFGSSGTGYRDVGIQRTFEILRTGRTHTRKNPHGVKATRPGMARSRY